MAEAASDAKEIEPTEAANGGGQQPRGIRQRIRGLLRKKDKRPADKPNDAVKLGCGGLFRRNKRTEADGEAEETHKKPSEKPKKSKGIKGGTVKAQEQQQPEPDELQLDTLSPAVAESVESAEAEQQQQQQPAQPTNPPKPLLELASNAGKEPAKNMEKAEENATNEKAATEKAAEEKATNEKAATEKATNEKSAAEKAAEEKATNDKAAADKAVEEKAAAEKAAEDEKVAAEKAAEEKASAEKATEDEKLAAEKAAEDEKIASEKAAKEKAAAEKAAAQKVEESVEKAEEQNGVSASDDDEERDRQRAAQAEFQRTSVDMAQVKAKPGVTLEQGPHAEMWSSIINKSFIGTGAFKRAAVCSLSSGAVLACNPADFTPTVEQVAALRENFDSRSVFSAAGFGLADTVYSMLEDAGSRDILCGADEPRGQTLLVCKTNTALLAAACEGAPGRAADMLGDMRQHFMSQGM